MSRFNQKQETGRSKTVNLAGGEAYKQSPELELVSILLTSFANDSNYRSADDTLKRLKELIKECDKKFVAQAAVYARTKFGMRSISHVVASDLAKHISGEEWAKDFYSAVVYRSDDMMEILSYHKKNNGKIPNAMKKGFARAFDKFDRYSLAKYRGEGKDIKLVDVVNIAHPVPNEKNSDALSDLVAGDLKSFDTWETELAKAGQDAANEQEKLLLKGKVWERLINERKLGYFALLRNLRNIITQSPQSLDAALEMLTDEKLIRKSLVLPFRFLSAYEEIRKLNEGQAVRKTMVALDRAVEIATDNVPKFDGETLVVLDVSGSMNEYGWGVKSPHIIGSLFSAVLVKSNNCDFMVFSDDAKYHNVNPLDSTMTISNSLRFASGGTNFSSIFKKANRKYDRIIILSDMQGWVGYYCPTKDFAEYKNKYGATPFVYSFDLKGYGSMQFPENNVFALAGFSEKVFDIMKMMEQDRKVLLNEIKKISF
jgi:60 kDa SS-A/Ro ribonucleoprotein